MPNLNELPDKTKKSLRKFTLTGAGERLLFVLSKPENYLLPIYRICKLAKISKTWYYKLYKREEFKEQAVVLAKGIFATATPAIASKVAEQAVKGSLPHQEIILEAVGVIAPKGMTITQQSLTQFNISDETLERITG